MKLFRPIIFTLVLASCEASYGDKYTTGNLEIYYASNIRIEFIEKTAAYFREHHLILDHKHSIQISRDQEGFILRMILNKKYSELPAGQQINLKLLEEDMKHVIFDDLNFRIEVTDENFRPIESEK